MDKRELFESWKVPRAVAALAMPTILSMLVTIIYNMVDMYFVGKTGDPNQVAAVSLAAPVFMLLMAGGQIFGLGGSSVISRRLGEGRRELLPHISSFCFYGACGAGILLTVLLLLFLKPILRLLGTSADTVGFTESYLLWIILGGTFVIVSFAFGNILRGVGAARVSMLGMMLGTVVNIILDPVMILWLGWGVTGAAIATIIGNIATTLFYLVYIIRREALLSVSPKDFRVSDHIPGNVMVIGLPASLNGLLFSVSNIVINNFLSSYGDIQVASMGVAMKANMLVFLIQIAISAGVQPLIGYNFGARNFARMKQVIRFALLCTVCFGTVTSVLFYVFSAPIIAIFLPDPEVIANGSLMLRASMFAGPVVGILFVITTTFQAMGKAAPALILSISRQGLIFLPVIFLGNRIAGLAGVIYALPITDYGAIAVAVTMFVFVDRKVRRELGDFPSDPYAQE